MNVFKLSPLSCVLYLTRGELPNSEDGSAPLDIRSAEEIVKKALPELFSSGGSPRLRLFSGREDAMIFAEAAAQPDFYFAFASLGALSDAIGECESSALGSVYLMSGKFILCVRGDAAAAALGEFAVKLRKNGYLPSVLDEYGELILDKAALLRMRNAFAPKNT